MLRLLSDALDEVRKVHGDHQVMLYFGRGSRLTGEAQLLVYRTRQDVTGDLNLSGAEAIGVLNELGDDGYLHLDYGKHGSNASNGIVNVRFRDKGHAAIEQLPDPNERLIAALDELVAAIGGLRDVDPADKEQAMDGARRVRGFLNQLPPGIAVEVASRLANILGVPGG